MTDESKDTIEQKVQNILHLIDELHDTKSLDKIKNHCIGLQDNVSSQQKGLYLKHALKEFTKYPELNELIQDLVVDLSHNVNDNIGKMGEDTYYSYKINLNDLIELKYEYSFTYGTCDQRNNPNPCDLYLYEIATYGGMEPDDTMGLMDMSLDEVYKAFKLKDTSMGDFKEFMLAIMEAVKYHPDAQTRSLCVGSIC